MALHRQCISSFSNVVTRNSLSASRRSQHHKWKCVCETHRYVCKTFLSSALIPRTTDSGMAEKSGVPRCIHDTSLRNPVALIHRSVIDGRVVRSKPPNGFVSTFHSPCLGTTDENLPRSLELVSPWHLSPEPNFTKRCTYHLSYHPAVIEDIIQLSRLFLLIGDHLKITCLIPIIQHLCSPLRNRLCDQPIIRL